MEVASNYISLGYPVRKVLSYCSLSKSSFYYIPKTGVQGRKPYARILNKQNKEVTELEIVNRISKLFSHEFVDYGSLKTYKYLTMVEQYKISKHKVYEIMKAHSLLRLRYQKSSKYQKRNWVKDLIPKTSGPFTYFEIDIKYVWINGIRRNAQMLTIIDVETRIVLGEITKYTIASKDVITLFEKVISELKIPTYFIIRSDNGSQFIANKVQNYLSNLKVTQEFTKPATPEQDAHIESYHSIFESAVCARFTFKNLVDLQQTVARFIDFYNFERLHSGTNYFSPFNNYLQREEEIYSSSPLKHFNDLLKQKYEIYLNNLMN